MIDTFQKESKLSRSLIIRLAIDSLAQNLIAALPEKTPIPGALDPLVGLLRDAKLEKRDIVESIDDIYLKD